jgi:ankyrin repeat protein
MLKKVKASLSGGDLKLIDKELMKECKKEIPSFERVKLLLEIEPKANPNIVDDDGNTPALLAAKQGNFQILQILIAHGANIEEKDRDGNTCIMLRR